MKMKQALISASMLAGVAMTSSAYAGPAEPSLTSILAGIESGTWTQVASFDDLLSESWNAAGTTLTFNFVSENTSWAAYQTFSIVDGSSSDLIFKGSDTNGATKTYTLTDVLYSYFFGETNPTSNFIKNKSKVFESPTGKYAFVHEDYTDNDYNDMVVSMTVTSVPEPETYAMMLAGLGFVGFVSRKKKAV